jgi:hypothetical protein
MPIHVENYSRQRFFSRHFSFPPSESFHQYSKFIHSSPTLEILASEDTVKKTQISTISEFVHPNTSITVEIYTA